MSLRVLTGHPGPPTGVDVDRRFSRAVACRRTAGQEQRSLRRSGLRPHAWLDIGGHSEPKRSQGLCGSDSDYCRRAVHASESDTSSGSRSASSSIEPLRSTKSTVTCLRSPSRALFEVGSSRRGASECRTEGSRIAEREAERQIGRLGAHTRGRTSRSEPVADRTWRTPGPVVRRTPRTTSRPPRSRVGPGDTACQTPPLRSADSVARDPARQSRGPM